MPGTCCSRSADQLLHLIGAQRVAPGAAGSRPLRARPSSSARLTSSVRRVRKALGSVGTEIDVVFQPDPAPARKIDPRLDRDHGVRGERLVGSGAPGVPRGPRDPGRGPASVRRPRRSPARRSPRGPGRPPRAPAGRHACPDGSRLRGPHRLVHQPLPLVGPGPDHDRPGQVGTVSAHLGTEVKQQPVPRADDPVAGPGVGQRRPGPRRDDGRKRVPLASPPPERRLQPRGNLRAPSSPGGSPAAPPPAPPRPAPPPRGSPPPPRAPWRPAAAPPARRPAPCGPLSFSGRPPGPWRRGPRCRAPRPGRPSSASAAARR